MAKKKEELPQAPIDKMDLYLKTNYKKIIGAASLIIVLFIVGYSIRGMQKQTRERSLNVIGAFEAAGLSTDEQFAQYTGLASTMPYASDYVYMQAAIQLTKLGKTEEALNAASQVSGSYKAFADSLSYDFKGGHAPVTADKFSGPCEPLWYYRAVLVAEGESKTQLMADFRTAWPDSLLLEQLRKWGY